MKRLTITIDDQLQLEPQCTGAFQPGFGDGPWHARCPVCDEVIISADPHEAIKAASAHCSRLRMRQELNALYAAIGKLTSRGE